MTYLNWNKSWPEVLFFVAIVFGITTFSVEAQQTGIRLGRLQIEPSLRYELTYHDNIFYEDSNEQDDFIHVFRPGILFKYDGNRVGNYIHAGYLGAFAVYSDFSDSNYETHIPYLALGYQSPLGFYFQVKDVYTKTEDPFGSENQYNIGQRTKRWNNVADAVAGYEFTRKYKTEFIYQNLTERFYEQRDKWQDRSGDAYGLALFYNLTPKTSVFVQYRRTYIEFDSQNDGLFDVQRNASWNSSNSQDHTLDDYFIGARFRPGGKLYGEVKFGYTSKEFDNEFNIVGNEYDDHSTWAAETQVNWAVTNRTLVKFILERSFLSSSDLDDVNYFIDTVAGVEVTQKFAYRLSANLSATWENWDYRNESEANKGKEFDFYIAGIGLNWDANDWLNTGITYEFTSKDANKSRFEDEEYDVNVVTVYVEAVY